MHIWLFCYLVVVLLTDMPCIVSIGLLNRTVYTMLSPPSHIWIHLWNHPSILSKKKNVFRNQQNSSERRRGLVLNFLIVFGSNCPSILFMTFLARHLLNYLNTSAMQMYDDLCAFPKSFACTVIDCMNHILIWKPVWIICLVWMRV